MSDCTTPTDPNYYYVIAVAGGGNAQGFGEGMPTEVIDHTYSRIKELGRFTDDISISSVTTESFNRINPARSTSHGLLDYRNNNHQDYQESFQKGLVSVTQYIGQRFLPLIPSEAGILIVNTSREGSSFGSPQNLGTYDVSTGADAASERWDVGGPLYLDLRDRIRFALDIDDRNVMLGVVWLNGETDAETTVNRDAYAANLTGFLQALNIDIGQSHSPQCPDGTANSVVFVLGSGTEATDFGSMEVINSTTATVADSLPYAEFVDLRINDAGAIIEDSSSDPNSDNRIPDNNRYFSTNALRSDVSSRIVETIRKASTIPSISLVEGAPEHLTVSSPFSAAVTADQLHVQHGDKLILSSASTLDGWTFDGIVHTDFRGAVATDISAVTQTLYSTGDTSSENVVQRKRKSTGLWSSWQSLKGKLHLPTDAILANESPVDLLLKHGPNDIACIVNTSGGFPAFGLLYTNLFSWKPLSSGMHQIIIAGSKIYYRVRVTDSLWGAWLEHATTQQLDDAVNTYANHPKIGVTRVGQAQIGSNYVEVFTPEDLGMLLRSGHFEIMVSGRYDQGTNAKGVYRITGITDYNLVNCLMVVEEVIPSGVGPIITAVSDGLNPGTVTVEVEDPVATSPVTYRMVVTNISNP